MRNTYFLLILILYVGACDSRDENFEVDQPGLQGTWLLTERGYSPGSGYIVEPVSPNPAQTVTFTGQKTFSSNVQGFAHFRFYVILKDASDVSKLHLYVEDPELVEHNTPAFNTFFIELADGNLKIMQVGCIEGCHLGFKKNGLSRE